MCFLARKGSYTTFNIVKIRKIWENKGKSEKTRSMTKKSHQKFLPCKLKFSPEKTVIQKSWSAKTFSVPQTRRQVSATATPCLLQRIHHGRRLWEGRKKISRTNFSNDLF